MKHSWRVRADWGTHTAACKPAGFVALGGNDFADLARVTLCHMTA
jgi:hypothetical protein